MFASGWTNQNKTTYTIRSSYKLYPHTIQTYNCGESAIYYNLLTPDVDIPPH